MTAKRVGSMEPVSTGVFFNSKGNVTNTFEVPAIFPRAYETTEVEWLLKRTKNKNGTDVVSIYDLFVADVYVERNDEGVITGIVRQEATNSSFFSTEDKFTDGDEYIIFCSYEDTYVLRVRQPTEAMMKAGLFKVEQYPSFEFQTTAQLMNRCEVAFLSALYDAL